MRRATVGLAIGVFALFAAGQVHADDQMIARQVHEALSQHKEAGQLQGFGVDLKVEDGLVWLNGYVSSQEQQTLVLNAARHVSGVKGVVNAMEIQGDYDAKPVSNLEELRAQSTMLQQEAAARQQNAQARLAQEQRASADAYAQREAAAVQMRNSYQQSVAAAQRPVPTPAPRAVPTPAPRAVPTPAPRAISYEAPRAIGSGVSNMPAQPVAAQPVATPAVAVQRPVAPMPVQQVAAPMQAQPAPAYANPAYAQQAAPRPIQQVSAPPMQQMGPPQMQQMAPQMAPQQYNPAYANQVDVSVGSGVNVGVGPSPYYAPSGAQAPAVRYDHPQMPGYAWPGYAAYPNYGAVTYPKQYSPTAWPYIGPFYPYPQVPLGWRKVTLEWDDGWWMLDFKDH